MAARYDLEVNVGLRPPQSVVLPPDLEALDGDTLLETSLTVEIVDDDPASTTGRKPVTTDVEVNPWVLGIGVAYRF